MSIIQNIRERGTWIIFTIIVIALVAFILQDGVGRQNGSNTTSLGTVNGEEIQKVAEVAEPKLTLIIEELIKTIS